MREGLERGLEREEEEEVEMGGDKREVALKRAHPNYATRLSWLLN